MYIIEKSIQFTFILSQKYAFPAWKSDLFTEENKLPWHNVNFVISLYKFLPHKL